MKIYEGILIIILVSLLVGGSYFLWDNMPGQPTEFQSYVAQHGGNETIFESKQFYPSMRFSDRVISYELESACDSAKKSDILGAMAELSNRTSLKFEESKNGEINFVCSAIAPEPEQNGHFVAGEGGPTEIINTTNYAIILSAKVSLYRTEKCTRPHIALHEILHALGFDHSNNPESIMYPVADCSQTLDQSIVDDINQLYRADSRADLVIEQAEANSTGRYLNFKIIVGNEGLRALNLNATLKVLGNGRELKDFNLGILGIGMRESLNVENVAIGKNVGNISFFVDSNGQEELNYDNNRVDLRIS